jgi:hypothetical protein
MEMNGKLHTPAALHQLTIYVRDWVGLRVGLDVWSDEALGDPEINIIRQWQNVLFHRDQISE